MFIEELFHGSVKVEAVLFVPKAVAFVVLDHVGNLDSPLFKGLHYLVRLRFLYPGVVGSLSDEEGGLDFIHMENR